MNLKTPFLLRCVRIFRLLCWLLGVGLRLYRLDKNDAAKRREVLAKMGQDCLNLAHVELQIATPPPSGGVHGSLIASNHVSWLDIFAISAVSPASFIAMKEIQSWPLFGKIGTAAGTVFIDRSTRKDIEPVNAAIGQVLQNGGNVAFFPEAHTSLGNGILPLKAALFQSAINSASPVQPVALRYYDEAGARTEAVSFADVNLLQSVWRIVSMRKIMVKVDFGAPIWPQTQPDADRFALKEQVEAFLNSKVLADSPNPQRLLK